MLKNYKQQELINRINIMGIRPLDVMTVGVTGAGKSTTLNALFQDHIVKVGVGVDPETMDISSHSLNPYFRVWDTPGLGDGKAKDISHSKLLIDLLHKSYQYEGNGYGFIDIILVIIEGSNRDMGTTYKLLNEIVVPNIQKNRILVAVNQADMAMKGRNWDFEDNKPTPTLQNFLKNQVNSIQKRILESTGIEIPLPIYYSAKYGYNIETLFDFMLTHMPQRKREFIA